MKEYYPRVSFFLSEDNKELQAFRIDKPLYNVHVDYTTSNIKKMMAEWREIMDREEREKEKGGGGQEL